MMLGLEESIGLAIIAGITGVAIMSMVVALVYPLLDQYLYSVTPELRGNIQLGLLALPFLTGLALIIIMLTPVLDYGPVSHHCHSIVTPECVPHSLQAFDRTLSLVTLLLTVLLVAWPLVRRTGPLLRLLRSSRGLRQIAVLDPEYNIYLIKHHQPWAFSIGLFRPAVFISTGLKEQLDPDELFNVINHEKAHLLRHDALRLFAGELFTYAHGPGTGKSLLRDLHLSCEQACDEYACRETGERLGVAATILKVERLFVSVPARVPIGANHMTGSSVPARINRLLYTPVENDAVVLCSTCLITVLLALMIFMAAEPLHHLIESLL